MANNEPAEDRSVRGNFLRPAGAEFLGEELRVPLVDDPNQVSDPEEGMIVYATGDGSVSEGFHQYRNGAFDPKSKLGRVISNWRFPESFGNLQDPGTETYTLDSSDWDNTPVADVKWSASEEAFQHAIITVFWSDGVEQSKEATEADIDSSNPEKIFKRDFETASVDKVEIEWTNNAVSSRGIDSTVEIASYDVFPHRHRF